MQRAPLSRRRRQGFPGLSGSETLCPCGELRNRLRAPLLALRGVASNADLRRIQLVFAGAEVGGWIAIVAAQRSVVQLTGGSTAFGLVLGLRMVAPALAAPFMGVLAIAKQRRRVMITADLTRCVLVIAAAAVVWADGPVIAVYVLTSAVMVASTAFRPAQAALLPSLARTPDELTASNAMSSTIESVSSFAGPAIAGVVVATAGADVGLR